MSASDEDKATAAAIKTNANEAFKCEPTPVLNSPETHATRFGRSVAKQFMEAAKLYGKSLEKNPTDPTVWLNRAFTRMNLVSDFFLTSAAIPI